VIFPLPFLGEYSGAHYVVWLDGLIWGVVQVNEQMFCILTWLADRGDMWVRSLLVLWCSSTSQEPGFSLAPNNSPQWLFSINISCPYYLGVSVLFTYIGCLTVEVTGFCIIFWVLWYFFWDLYILIMRHSNF